MAANSAQAAEDLTWSYAQAQVATCTVRLGGTCGTPGGLRVLDRETLVQTNVGYNNASVHLDDYSPSLTPDYGRAWASAEAGDGLLALPVLKAYALGGGTGFGSGPDATPNPTIAVNVAGVHAIQGYTNTGSTDLIIPLNAFTGLVHYVVSNGNPGTVYAGLAITTSAILDPTVSAQWFGTNPQSGFGQFTGSCSTPGALAIANPAPSSSGVGMVDHYLPVTTASCGGQDTYTLAAGESFYVWARLAVLRSAFGVTDASHTFNVTITPEAAPFVAALAPSLTQADGANLNIRTGAVPEPATWAMMILGFGAAGSLLRRRGGAVRA